MGKTTGSFGLLSVVFVAGAGTMVVELAAVRVLAPWFGTSSTVWTNVIGVVMLALALGYLVGSKLSSRPRPLASLGACLLFAAGLTCWLPAGASIVAETFLPAGLTLDRSAGLLVWGSLATSLILFGPPAAMLGCVGPLAVECVQVRSGAHAGTAGGRVLFASTMGSLLGTFGTTHFLIPGLGVGATMYLAAIVLGLLGLSVCAIARRGVGAAVVAGLLACGAALAVQDRTRQVSSGTRLLASAESSYQSLRVVEFGEGPTLMRQLQVNEGFDSFQSVWQKDPGLLPRGYYYNYFCPPAWWSAAQGEWNVLVLGLGAGTAVRVMQATLPPGATLASTGVEIDAKVVELAARWMSLETGSAQRQVLSGWDARVALDHLQRSYDQIVLDTYANQMEIPAHLCSVEFFARLKEQLTDGGWLTINIGGFGFDDPVVRAISETASVAFGSEALVLRVPFSRNCIAYLRRAAPLPRPQSPEWWEGSEELRSLLSPVELDGAWTLVSGASGVVLTDDRNPIDELQRESIARRADQLAELEG